MDDALPLFERIKFLAIYSNNMEEFYQVRVSYYKQMLRQEKRFPDQIKKVQPATVIKQINRIVSEQQEIFHKFYNEQIIPALKESGIYIIEAEDNLTEEQKNFIQEVFFVEILTQIQPVILIKHRVRPFLNTGNVYLALEMVIKDRFDKKTGKRRDQYSLIKVPLDRNLPRFIQLPSDDGKHYIMFLEDVIMRHADAIFPGYLVNNYYSIKLTRDADLEYDDYEGEELIDRRVSLATIGAPTDAEGLGIDEETVIEALTTAHEIRDRYTVLGDGMSEAAAREAASVTGVI